MGHKSIACEEKSPSNKWAGLVLLFLASSLALLVLLHLASLLFGPSKEKCKGKACITKFLEGPPAFNDPQMVRYLQDRYITGPTSSKYNLSGNTGADSIFVEALEFINKSFKNKEKGTFVVLGAGDGEYQDITLQMEKERGWSGLLIEPNPHLFSMMKSKGRHSHMANLCVSPYTFSARVKFAYPTHREDASEEDQLKHYRNCKFHQAFSKENDSSLTTFTSQCVPLENIVYAVPSLSDGIDILVLDMSDTDLTVLSNVNLEQMPQIKMIIAVTTDGKELAKDINSYFMDQNLVFSKIIGNSSGKRAYFILTRTEGYVDI